MFLIRAAIEVSSGVKVTCKKSWNWNGNSQAEAELHGLKFNRNSCVPAPIGIVIAKMADGRWKIRGRVEWNGIVQTARSGEDNAEVVMERKGNSGDPKY